MPIIRCKIRPDSIVYTDCWRSYNGLDVSEFKHYRINQSKLFAQKQNHINGIPRQHFELVLKECEWRFNPGASKEHLNDLKKLLKELY